MGEESYQKRLRNWEAREASQSTDFERIRRKEENRVEIIEREGKKLREFLEDYDDDRDDEKYYKGAKLDQRMRARQIEADRDHEDRAREKDEIEALRHQIMKEGHFHGTDVHAELQRRMGFTNENQAPPNGSTEHDSGHRGSSQHGMHMQHRGPPPGIPLPTEPQREPEVVTLEPEPPAFKPEPVFAPAEEPEPVIYNEPDSGDDGGGGMDMGGGGYDDDASPSPRQQPSPVAPPPVPDFVPAPVPVPEVADAMHGGRKRMDVRDVFNQDDDDDAPGGKRRKGMPPLGMAETPTKSASASAAASTAKMTSDEKRRHIKSLIDKIPTDKNDLFAYAVDWDHVDQGLIEKCIRPWVNKKIAEYIGEPEPTLTDFICSKVLAGSTPKAVLEDVQMVLDEEAEVFVVKMWRLLIYEIENKKLKAATGSTLSFCGTSPTNTLEVTQPVSITHNK